MSENKKPNVFPDKNAINEANNLTEKLNNEIYDGMAGNGSLQKMAEGLPVVNPASQLSETQRLAAEEMARVTAEQIRVRDERMAEAHRMADETEAHRAKIMNPLVYRPELAEESIKPQGTVEYGDKPVQHAAPVVKEDILTDEVLRKFEMLNQPQMNVSFDVIPLPSNGKLYRNKNKSLNVAFLNASDENILTNPNLIESGKFLEVLLNRKIMDPTVRYKDLHVGDRNAIMIWLRSTGYGPEYPITLYEPVTFTEFETVINLSELKIKTLDVDTDVNGYIDYVLPTSKKAIKFKLLTVGDVDDIEAHDEKIKSTLGPEFSDSVTYSLKKQITCVDGDYNPETISTFVDRMMLPDVRSFRNYVNQIESGVDMNLTVRTPGGESINTFLPLNFSFFWPEL